MYWCKKTKYSSALLTSGLLICLSSCKPEVKQDGRLKYFDLKKYFKAEAVKLTKQGQSFLKTVVYNNNPESKTVTIKNWERELALFIESDINKPSWRDSYKMVSNTDSITYHAIDTNLRTRYIGIQLKAGKVNAVHITNFTKNLLYQTTERLTYYPDSVYKIEKHQAVKIMGTNDYLITGKFK